MTRFTVGQAVRVSNLATYGHNRVPLYVRGRTGTVERVIRPFLIPEDDAWGRRDGRRQTLYRVRIPNHEIWPDYRGDAADELQLEIYEHWLEEMKSS